MNETLDAEARDIEIDVPAPLEGRKSISLLLGAGFSAPMGYPIGNQMNERICCLANEHLVCSPSGQLMIIPDAGVNNNNFQRRFEFCKRLIRAYKVNHRFDYEEFYDFICSEEVNLPEYQSLSEGLLCRGENYGSFLADLRPIYSQMVAYLLKDGKGQQWYDMNGVQAFSNVLYHKFLYFLAELRKEYNIHVHTLNHDLFFESFNTAACLYNCISDGFQEYGSDYYGVLRQSPQTYHCRLEYYTGNYETPIQLFKLHGSLDYVLCYREGDNGFLLPETYVKTKYGIGVQPYDIIKEVSDEGYRNVSLSMHGDFLTGTTAKILRYEEPVLFKRLFEHFEQNLQQAEQLIIIGYGCKDERINEIIQQNFASGQKQAFVFDPYAEDGGAVAKFAEKINAKLLKKHIQDFDPELLK